MVVIESSVGFVGLSKSWALSKVVDKFSGLSNGIAYWLCCEISMNVAYFCLWANLITFYLFSWIKNILITQMLVYLGLLMTFYCFGRIFVGVITPSWCRPQCVRTQRSHAADCLSDYIVKANVFFVIWYSNKLHQTLYKWTNAFMYCLFLIE